MKTRNRLMAVLGASVLALGIAGVALATDLNTGQVGKTLGTFDQDCDGFPLEVGAGEIGVHFVLTSPDSQSGNLTASFSNPASSVGPVANGEPQEAAILHFYVVITGDLNTVIESASTDTSGNKLNVSHVCAGAPAPTFTDEPGGETSAPTETPSFTDEPGGDTDAPSEPNTAAAGGIGTSGPADGAWLLVVALGVLLASVVVLTPARAKSRR